VFHVRLNKFLSDSGACSRREADEFIAEGRVTINGVPATLGTQVNEGDDVRLDGDTVGHARKKDKPVYIALNKPTGITCTTERHVPGNIIDFIAHTERIFPIGRLDKDSEGLILLTNDGDIVNEVLRVEHGHEKEYVVSVDHAITPEFVEGMERGVRLSDATTKPCRVERLGPKVFRIYLKQGLNRQIRRMCEAFGFTVVTLQRTRVMHIKLGELPVGRWRNLTEQEIAGLMPEGGPRTQQPRPQQRPPQRPPQQQAQKPKPPPRAGGGQAPARQEYGFGPRPGGGGGRPGGGRPGGGRPGGRPGGGRRGGR
jgi:23S rRNA pseudouridine2604 synthase